MAYSNVNQASTEAWELSQSNEQSFTAGYKWKLSLCGIVHIQNTGDLRQCTKYYTFEAMKIKSGSGALNYTALL